VRELRNVLERALLLAGGAQRLDRSDLRFDRALPRAPGDLGGFADDLAEGGEVVTLAEMERQYIERVLRRADGAVDRAATWLGIARSTLYQKLRRYRDSA
jgi:DNA-binding NtrC family response regulator